MKFEQNFSKRADMAVCMERVHAASSWNALAMGRVAMAWWQ
jgi:hypothetical protein